MIDLAVVILVFAVLLALVALLQPLAQRLGLPHSVLLAGLGIALGAVPLLAPMAGGVGVLGGLGALALGSDAIVYLFLPILLFQAGLTIDVRRMIDDIAPVLLMAVVEPASLFAPLASSLALGGRLSLSHVRERTGDLGRSTGSLGRRQLLARGVKLGEVCPQLLHRRLARGTLEPMPSQ